MHNTTKHCFKGLVDGYVSGLHKACTASQDDGGNNYIVFEVVQDISGYVKGSGVEQYHCRLLVVISFLVEVRSYHPVKKFIHNLVVAVGGFNVYDMYTIVILMLFFRQYQSKTVENGDDLELTSISGYRNYKGSLTFVPFTIGSFFLQVLASFSSYVCPWKYSNGAGV
ncbi:hypothetical protein FN846DRAFT_886014 [Sphaerosporella brunnea]|uniref:Uncharacterized protein n=1 Tax=Sphaerosporella brunnea TaxID=1250544 RepID=A0A5J5FB36_9PEZI|nr:hypothetical protein FN846DRAFT_886014 [Sphaerosporella brunnea]